MVEEHRASSLCPSCDRFVGPYETCPYCGAAMGRRLPVRLFKYGSLVVAVAGVAILFLVAARSQVPTVEVGALSGTMNWAYVRVEGTVSRQTTWNAEAGTVQFWVWDGSGEILVLAYQSVAEQLLADELVPVMGDTITLEGTLRVKDDFEYLVLETPQRVEIRTPEAVERLIGEVEADQRLQRVLVQGMVRDERLPYEGMRILTLRDATGEIDVIWPTGEQAPEVRVGQSVQIRGAVDLYRGTPQIVVGRGSDVRLLDEEVVLAPARRTGDLALADVGSMVSVEGTVTRVQPFSAGVKLMLDDGSGAVTLLLWQELYQSLPDRAALAEGTRLLALGEVAEYGGALEIIPQVLFDVRVTAPAVVARTAVASVTDEPPPAAMATNAVVEVTSAPTPAEPTPAEPTPAGTAPPEPTLIPATATASRSLDSITDRDVGTTVTLERAEIEGISHFSRGLMATLNDGKGRIILLLWQELLEELPIRYDLIPGAWVGVTGRVNLYQGELEIVPRSTADVGVLEPVRGRTAEEAAVSDITAADDGRLVVVEGVVNRVEGDGIPATGGGWLRLWLDDGSGQLLVFVPERVVEYLPGGIAAGSRLRITGEVGIYQGQMEVIPLAGADVELR